MSARRKKAAPRRVPAKPTLHPEVRRSAPPALSAEPTDQSGWQKVKACLCTGYCRGIAPFAPDVLCRLDADMELLP